MTGTLVVTRRDWKKGARAAGFTGEYSQGCFELNRWLKQLIHRLDEGLAWLAANQSFRMTPASKPEFPPLLPAGFHHMTWDDLLTLCVKRFPLSAARREIANGLRRVLDRIEAAAVPCEVWLDGSFLTEKNNPEDVDLVVYFDQTR